MIADLRRIFWPRVYVNVLVICLALLRQRLRHKHVVELLGIHVEEVGVALELINLDYCIKVLESRYLDILFERFNKGELIEVACSYDAGILVLGKDVLFSLVSFALVTLS